jgi:hypothetical protein
LSRNESGRFGALKSDSTHHFFRNACTKSGSLRFSQLSGCWLILSVYIIMSLDFDLCHVLSSSTTNFAHAQTLSRMSSLSGRMNIARVNIGFFNRFKNIKQWRISFVLGYLRMILWKISTTISIKHRILTTFNIKKKIQFWQPLNINCNLYWLLMKKAHGTNRIVEERKHWRILYENDTKRRIQQALCKNLKNMLYRPTPFFNT